MIIKASFFEKARKKLPDREKICVLNLHGNIGNKLSCFSNIETILKLGLEACCFDFLGCGNSDGEYITLGN